MAPCMLYVATYTDIAIYIAARYTYVVMHADLLDTYAMNKYNY